MIILFYISLFLYIATLSISVNIIDYDLWARLVVGKTFFQTGKLLNFDFQSFGPTRQWFDHEWGSSLIFYSILDKFGDVGIIIFKTLAIFLTYFIITRIILLRRKHLNKTIENPYKIAPFNILFFVFLIQATLDVVFSTIRCQIFTFIFFAMWLYALEKSRLENNFKILWIIPTTMILWANIHGGCFTGLGLLALYIAGEFLNKKPVKPYIIVFFLSLCAMFINPYGIKYVYFLFHAITLKRTHITEWQPIFSILHFLRYFKYKLWASGVSIIVLYYLIKKYKNCSNDNSFIEKFKTLYNNLDKTKALVLIIMLLLSLKTLRLIPFFAFTAAAFLYDDIYKVFNKKLNNRLNNIKETILFILILLSFVYTIKTLPIEARLVGYPYAEAEFLKENNLKGNLFANFHYGSFLAYKLYPNNFIFMDGRYEETYDPKLLDRLDKIYTLKNWEEELNKQRIDYIILEKRYKDLTEKLTLDENWIPVVESKEFTLFINKDLKQKNFKKPSGDFNYYQKTKWQTNIDWSTK